MILERKVLEEDGASQRKRIIEAYLEDKSDVLSARIYGSSCFNRGKSEDVDVAVMVPSSNGVCEFGLYGRLRLIRQDLTKLTEEDVDIIPHTVDEFDRFSPLQFPRYNPSLFYGINLKGEFPVQRPPSSKSFSIKELSEYVLLDSRTITRRQILRPTSYEDVRIFLSKLAHGPGNVMTLLSYTNGSEEYLANPSDSEECFDKFREHTGIDMSSVLGWINVLKYNLKEKIFSPDDAFPLITWYESLVAGTLNQDYSQLKKYMTSQFKRPGILLVVKDEDNQILFIQRDNKPTIANPGVWYPPTETIESEHPDKTAVRCGIEELGVRLTPQFIKKDTLVAGHPRFIYAALIPRGETIHLGEGQGYKYLKQGELENFPLPPRSLDFLQGLFSL